MGEKNCPITGMKPSWLTACTMTSLLFGLNIAQQPPRSSARMDCSEPEALHAEDQSVHLKSWQHLYRSFRQFGQCDDGALSEGYSETVVRLLAHDWKHFSELNAIVRTDADFKLFVLRHIDALSAAKDLRLVVRNARQDCPKEARPLCKSLEQASELALKNSD